MRQRPKILLALLGFALPIAGCAHVTVQVRNDTGKYVRIASCVDDSADIGPGETFDAGGLTEEDRLFCIVAPNAENGRCVAIPHAHEIHETFLLSEAIPAPHDKC
jgi:hypothetical protein